MKFYNRMISLLLALIMSLSLMATAFAVDNGSYSEDPENPYDVISDSEAPENPDDATADTEENPLDPTEFPDDNLPDDGDIDPANYTGDTDVTWNFTGADESTNQLGDMALVTSFKDVKSSDWFYSDVMECAKLGIVAGFTDGNFKPNDNVTTVQFLVMMTRTFFNDKVETIKAPSGSKWYYANTKVAEDTGLSKGLEVDENPMNRYNMALVLYNEILKSGKYANATDAQLENAKASIKDFNSMTAKQKTWVKYCYALNILTGMSDGTFSGNNKMNRAQACAVIMRMLKLVNNYNPGDQDNNVYDDGKSQDTGNTGNNNQTSNTSGKLANGKDITVANVNAMLADIKKQFPEGTSWGLQSTPNTNSYNWGGPESINSVAAQIISKHSSTTSTRYACGGWANMVSTTIFGATGNPCREVTKTTDLRPGDILIVLNAKTSKLSHVGIVTGVTTAYGVTSIYTCDGNSSGGCVSWSGSRMPLETPPAGSRYVAYTRYPA